MLGGRCKVNGIFSLGIYESRDGCAIQFEVTQGVLGVQWAFNLQGVLGACAIFCIVDDSSFANSIVSLFHLVAPNYFLCLVGYLTREGESRYKCVFAIRQGVWECITLLHCSFTIDIDCLEGAVVGKTQPVHIHFCCCTERTCSTVSGVVWTQGDIEQWWVTSSSVGLCQVFCHFLIVRTCFRVGPIKGLGSVQTSKSILNKAVVGYFAVVISDGQLVWCVVECDTARDTEWRSTGHAPFTTNCSQCDKTRDITSTWTTIWSLEVYGIVTWLANQSVWIKCTKSRVLS